MELLSEFELVDTEQKWMKEAACRGKSKGEDGSDIFFPEVGYNKYMKDARALCQSCIVRQRCLDFAMNNEITHGIWGGKSAAERKSLRKWLNS